MKKLVLIAAAAAALAASAITPASAGFKGCCGGWNPGGRGFHHHWHGGWGGGVSIGLVGDAGYGGDCYYVRRNVLIPNIGIVSKRELVCG